MNKDLAMADEDPEALFATWAVRVEAGEELSFETFVQAHAKHDGPLRRLHDDWKLFAPLLGRVVPGLIASSESISLPPLSAHDEDAVEQPSPELLDRLGIHAPNEGRYRFRSVIGRGGGGIVLKVWDTKLNRPLAMKVVLGRGEGRPTGETPKVDGRTLSRFVDEARIASQLNHPGIVPVHELGADESGRAFFTMKLVKGEDLSVKFDHVKSGKDGWNQTRALTVILRACEAMAFAHDKGVVHRDLKPANIMVGSYGEVYVMDWGLARVLGEKDHRDIRIRPRPTQSVVDSLRTADRDGAGDSPLLTINGVPIGTPAYMSPEQAKGDVEAVGVRSDVYAIGAMLYELVAGQMPYVAPGTQVGPYTVVRWVTEGPPKPLAELVQQAPAELVAIAERAMARNPAQRYADTRGLADDLRAFLEGRVVRAYETGTWAETKKWVRRNRALAVSFAAGVLALMVGLTVSLIFKSKADDRSREANRNLYVASVSGAASARRLNEPATVSRLLKSSPAELRNWEWGYLNAASDTSLLTLSGHEGGVTCMAYSPDGTRIVTGSADNTARIWNSANGKQVAILDRHADLVTCAVFSPDGTRIVTTSRDGTAQVWEAATGRHHKTLTGDRAKLDSRRHGPQVYAVAFSPDGTLVVSAGTDSTSYVWSVTSGNIVARLGGHKGSVSSAIFSPNGATIVTTSIDSTVRIWDVVSGNELKCLAVQSARISSGAFSADGTRLVTASDEGTVRIWSTSTWLELASLHGESGAILSASFTGQDSRLLLCAVESVRILDSSTGALVHAFKGHTDRINCALLSSNGDRLVTASDDNSARIWNVHSGREIIRLEGHSNGVNIAAFSPDGTRVASASEDSSARIWDALSNGGLTRLEGHMDRVNSVRFSPDGYRAVTASDDGTARVWDVATARELVRIQGHAWAVNFATFSPDGAYIVTASSDGTARLWDSVCGKEIRRLLEQRCTISYASFDPHGRHVVVASDNGAVTIVDVTTGAIVKMISGVIDGVTLSGDLSGVNSCVYNCDGTIIATASDDKTVRLWSAESGRQLAELSGNDDMVRSASFSPSGAALVTATSFDRAVVSRVGEARLWRIGSPASTTRLQGHTAGVWSADFNPKGNRIVTASQDLTVRVWDATDATELARLEGHTYWVTSATFSTDGTSIASSSFDHTACVWHSVPYRVRYARLKDLAGFRHAGELAYGQAVTDSEDFVHAAHRLRNDPYLDSDVRRMALHVLSERSFEAQTNSRRLDFARSELACLSQLLGLEPSISESEARAALDAEADCAPGTRSLRAVAEEILSAEGSLALADESRHWGDEIAALVLARELVINAPPADNARHRSSLARALFSVGKFAEALAEQREALGQAPDSLKAELEARLRQLESDLTTWCDETGELRRVAITERRRTVMEEIERLEHDAGVTLWRNKRR